MNDYKTGTRLGSTYTSQWADTHTSSTRIESPEKTKFTRISIGLKEKMAHTYKEGKYHALTLVSIATRYYVCQLKTSANDGYEAVQVGFGINRRSKTLTKPLLGHFSKAFPITDLPAFTNPRKSRVHARNTPTPCQIHNFFEFRVSESSEYRIGETLKPLTLHEGDKVAVTATRIGKGFLGNQKRHNFHRGPISHGSKNHKLPGSIGAGSTPGRVYPGKKMAGRLSSKGVNTKLTEVFYVSPHMNVLTLKGSFPGKKGSLVKISKI